MFILLFGTMLLLFVSNAVTLMILMRTRKEFDFKIQESEARFNQQLYVVQTHYRNNISHTQNNLEKNIKKQKLTNDTLQKQIITIHDFLVEGQNIQTMMGEIQKEGRSAVINNNGI